MDERTTRLREIVGRAAELAGAQRDAYLASACGADAELAGEARELLAAALVDDAFLRPLAPRAAASGASEPRAGSVIGAFTLVRAIGSGGMGQVWEAEQHAPRRRVALKLVHADCATSAALARFEREAGLLARLRHPGIAQVIASGVDDAGGGAPGARGARRPWYALELIEQATPLAQAARALPLRRRIELLADVCDAIHHAHLRGVVHRDLKSANVLVDAAGRARVIDFGIARELDAGAGLTHSGELLGTLGSMSPEQLSGDPALVDARTDVWALGVLGYELACGSPPFPAQGRALPALARAIEQDAPRPPSELAPEVERDLELVLLHALEKDPARRYASADALRADLSNWLAGRPIVARPATTLYQLRMFARRHRAASAALAAIVVVSLAAAAISTRFGFQARAAERQSARRFDDVRALARSVLFELHDSIERVPGATEARQKLAAKGLEYLDLLERDAADDALLLCEIGEGRLRLAE
ncbi:MAG: serine/threonine protein kinase, partial [Planctomycetota bacterium]